MYEDNLRKDDWLIGIRKSINEILDSDQTDREKLDALTHIVIQERAEMLREVSFDLRMPNLTILKEEPDFPDDAA